MGATGCLRSEWKVITQLHMRKSRPWCQGEWFSFSRPFRRAFSSTFPPTPTRKTIERKNGSVSFWRCTASTVRSEEDHLICWARHKDLGLALISTPALSFRITAVEGRSPCQLARIKGRWGRGTECLDMSLHQALWRPFSNRKRSDEEMMHPIGFFLQVGAGPGVGKKGPWDVSFPLLIPINKVLLDLDLPLVFCIVYGACAHSTK